MKEEEPILPQPKVQVTVRESPSTSSIASELHLLHQEPSGNFYSEWTVIVIAAIVFIGCIVSPPSLMDDVDAVHAQIARNMLTSGDWTIAHLDDVPYLEKAPLMYWIIAIFYRIMGVHDWVARIPIALAAVLLCWTVARYGRWAFGRRAGFYAGLSLATCAGLFLFTRILIPDVMLTLTICTAFWSFQRALEEKEGQSRLWAGLLAGSLAIGILLKGLIAVVLPVGGALLYLALTRQIFSRQVWKRLHIFSGLLIVLAIAAPWHILAARRMPPYFDLTLHSGPGQYHGFFWFYFMNEHVLRFLGLRYPRDYNTVPRLAFWLLNLVWLFPWCVYLPAAARLHFKPVDRAGRTCLLALCWTGFLLVFFSFSTTQEYYSMPVYPALALLLGSAMAASGRRVRLGTRTIAVICVGALLVIGAILYLVHGVPAPGDISNSLVQHPEAYTLALGHLGDLTLRSFAYLRAPLIVAGLGFLIGLIATWWRVRAHSFDPAALGVALMMVCFVHASRMALVVFDPYLSSRPLAKALDSAPAGNLIVDGPYPYYSFSSVFFYTNSQALLLNGRVSNLEYGSYAPGAPDVFIDDSRFRQLWLSSARYYLLADASQLARLSTLVGDYKLMPVAESGGKFLFTNNPAGSPSSTFENKDHPL